MKRLGFFALAASLAACAPQAGWPPLGEANDAITTKRVTSFGAEPKRVLATADRLWVLDDAKVLTSMAFDGSNRMEHFGGHDVVAMHRTDAGELWALVVDGTSDDARVFALRKGAWAPIVEWTASEAGPLALTDVEGRPVVIEQGDVMYEVNGRLETSHLSSPIDATRLRAAPGGPDQIYVGTNGWGGSTLLSIRISTGAVTWEGCPPSWRTEGQGVWPGTDPSAPTYCSGVQELVKDPVTPGCVYVAYAPDNTATGGHVAHVCNDVRSVVHGPWELLRIERPLALSELFEPSRIDSKKSPSSVSRAGKRAAVDPCETDILACGPTRYGVFALDAAVRGPHHDLVVLTDTALVTIPTSRRAPANVTLLPFEPKAPPSVLVHEGLAVLGAPSHPRMSAVPTVAPISEESAASATLSGCYRVAGGDDRLCLEDSRITLHRNGSTMEVFVAWREQAPQSFEGTVGEGMAITAQVWPDTLLLSQRRGYERYGVFLERIRPGQPGHH
ncbi:MAG: hypothetical protein HOW73_27805 [Polyangiaceae bacterium]|nr:hypothetical protein [Polyangiaceae bacterium]